MNALNPLDYGWAAVALPFLVLWLLARRRAGLAERRAEGLSAELDALKHRPVVWEGRVDRHDLLWFPVVTGDPNERKILSVKPGVPHCSPCIKAMSIQGPEWVCAGCGQRRPESVADLMITDGVAKEAARHFLARREGWRGL